MIDAHDTQGTPEGTPEDTPGQVGQGSTEVPEGTGQDTSDDQGDAQDPDDTDDGNPNHESAKWRTKFRQAERERDEARQQLTEARKQVTALRQSIIDQIATDAGLRDPRLLGREGYPVDDLLTDDGTAVDEDRVKQACSELIKRHNIATRRTLEPNFQQGAHGSSAVSASQQWAKAFAPRRSG